MRKDKNLQKLLKLFKLSSDSNYIFFKSVQWFSLQLTASM